MSKETIGHIKLKKLIKACLRPIYRKVRFCTLKILSSSFFQKTRAFMIPQTVSRSEIRILTVPNSHIFFGYYDVTPFSHDDGYLLAQKTRNILSSDVSSEQMEIGYFSLEEKHPTFQVLGVTDTWCWQQGCRLQWLSGKNEKIIYNKSIDGNYGSVIQNVTTGKVERKIPHPVYSVASDGKKALSLDFSRLQRLRPGYGYSVFPEKSLGDFLPEDNGITFVDLESGKSNLVVSLSQIAAIAPHESMERAEHYFNHIMFNHSGNRFLFLHLWVREGRRYSRLLTSNLAGTDIRLLNNSGVASHYNWISNNEIVLFSKLPSGKLAYAIFKDDPGKDNYEILTDVPEKDGHPTLICSNSFMITDTYPDIFSQRNLLLCDLVKGNTKVLARFDSPNLFAKDVRCDLHPRISNTSKQVCVDTVVNGNRAMGLIRLEPKYFG